MGRDRPQVAVNCPFCGSSDTETIAPWGGQLIVSQARCRSCNSYFEVVRDASQPEPP
ncbi:MAG: hypothetical protein ACRDMX_07790 [Solirubrobacteraceae bacterium]